MIRENFGENGKIVVDERLSFGYNSFNIGKKAEKGRVSLSCRSESLGCWDEVRTEVLNMVPELLGR